MPHCIVRLGNDRYLSFDENLDWFEVDDPNRANTFASEAVAHDALRRWGIEDYTILIHVE